MFLGILSLLDQDLAPDFASEVDPVGPGDAMVVNMRWPTGRQEILEAVRGYLRERQRSGSLTGQVARDA